MSISLPYAFKVLVDEQLGQGDIATSSECLREPIRTDRDCLSLQRLLLAGAASAPTTPVDTAWFDGLRDTIRKTVKSGARA